MRGAKRGAAGAETVRLEGLAASARMPKCPLDVDPSGPPARMI